MKLVALQVEEQLPLFEPLLGIFEGLPDPAIPHHHRTGAVVAFRNDAFEIAVLERVILDFDGEPLVGGIGGWPLRHCPRPEDAIHLEAQIPVQTRRVVHVDDEQPTRFGRRLGD